MAEPVIIVMGPPGAGKGTQSAILAQKLGGVHLSAGQVLRQVADPKMRAVMDAGGLLPSEVVCQAAAEVLKHVPQDQVIVLDGFTRLLAEAEWLDKYLDSQQRQVKKVILLKIGQEEGIKRNQLRGREDDTPQAQQHRWQLYKQETEPILGFYRNQGLLAEINGEGTVEEVAQRVQEALNG